MWACDREQGVRDSGRGVGEGLSILAILLLAAVLRFLWIGDGWFGVDQARDIAWARAIASAEAFPLVGPLMRGRVHLGASYYYFWSIPALLSTEPLASYGFAALLGIAAVWMTYRLGRQLGGAAVGLAAALLLATTPIAVIDARIAWAPAALPPLVAAFLLAGLAFLRRPTLALAALVLGLPILGTQLHLAAAPLGLLGVSIVFARLRQLGVPRALLAGAVALVPLLPMALAYHLDAGPAGTMRGDTRSLNAPTDGGAANAPAAPPLGEHPSREIRAGRLADILASSARVIDGLSPPVGKRPRLASAWVVVEHASMLATLIAALACAGFALGSPARANAAVGLVAATIITCVLVVAVLPAEAWYYYLDTTLVPAAVALALAVRPGHSRLAALAILCLALLRAVGLVWWIASNHGSGFMLANLERLRLGGSDPDASTGRARLLTVRTKAHAADVLLGDLALPLPDLWRRAHGAGFGDLDGDNGFFFQRAAARAPGQKVSALAPADEVLVVYAHELPDAWTAGFSPPHRVGPLAIYRYVPSLDGAEATIESCGNVSLPPRPVPDPRDYFFGQPSYPEWPCRDAVVRVPVDSRPDQKPVRIFARGLGAARVIAISSEPPGIIIDDAPPGAGSGLLLPPSRHAIVRVALAVEGPAALDLYELHGGTSDVPSLRP